MPRRGSTKHIEQDYEAGRLAEEVQNLEEAGVFSDPDFPPTVASLINTREVPPFCLDVSKFSRHTAWKRAPDIAKDNRDSDHPVQEQRLMSFEGIRPTAVKQGGLENCYFLASLTSLSVYPERITRLFLAQSNPVVYAVRLYCNGAPKEVVVDNWLPIDKKTTSQLPPPVKLPRGASILSKLKTDNGDGTSTIKMEIAYPDGRLQIQQQTVDNDAVTTKLKFSRTTTDELWVPILEKCYAKIQGSYAALEAGCHFETIRDLTGAPGFYWMSVQDNHWPLMEQFHALRYPMSCGIDRKYGIPDSDEALQGAGVVPDHVYSLLAVCTVQTSSGPQRLLKLRNPWGDAMEWTGNWGNRSTSWTSAIRDQIRQKGIPLEDPAAKDGIFWIGFEDFCQYFNSWDVNKYHDQHQFSAALLEDAPCGYHLVTVHVQQAGPYTFGVSQCSNRMMPTSARYKYSSVRAILVQATSNSDDGMMDVAAPGLNAYRFLKGVVGETRDAYIEMQHLEPGMYYMFVQVWWDNSAKHLPNKEVSMNCYGCARVKFDRDFAPQCSIEAILTEIFAAKAKQEMGSGRLACRHRGLPNAQNIQEYYNRVSCPEGYQFHLFCNMETDNIQLKEDKKFLSLKNAELVKPTKQSADYKINGKNKYSIRVQPGETKGVFLKVKSTFGMAGPTGKAFIIMPDGSNVAEREKNQTPAQYANLPPNTGVTSSNDDAPPVELETLYAGGMKGRAKSRKSRKSSVLGSIMGGLRGSTAAAPNLRKSKRNNENDGTGAQPSKRRSFFSGWGSKKSKNNNHNDAPAGGEITSTPTVGPELAEPQQKTVQWQPELQSTLAQQQPAVEYNGTPKSQVGPSDAVATFESFSNDGGYTQEEAQTKKKHVHVAGAATSENARNDNPSYEPTPATAESSTALDDISIDKTLPTFATSAAILPPPPPPPRAVAPANNPSPTKTVPPAASKEQPRYPVKRNKKTQSKPGFFRSLFGHRGKQKGRTPTPEESKILSKYPELKGATVLENTVTVTTTKKGDEVIATRTVTTLRLVQ